MKAAAVVAAVAAAAGPSATVVAAGAAATVAAAAVGSARPAAAVASAVGAAGAACRGVTCLELRENARRSSGYPFSCQFLEEWLHRL